MKMNKELLERNGVVQKGEIWHIEQGDTTPTGTEIWGNRPAIIVSNNSTNAKAGFVNVVYLTTANKREMPYHIKVISGGKHATALCEQIVPVDKSRIGFYIGKITDEEMLAVDKALLFSLGISNTIKPSTLYKKWACAIDRYKLDLSGNPAEDDTQHVNILEVDYSQALKERDLYKTLYETEKTKSETLCQLIH